MGVEAHQLLSFWARTFLTAVVGAENNTYGVQVLISFNQP